MSTQFKAGDRVEVHGMIGHYDKYNGLLATVTLPPQHITDSATIKPDGNSIFGYTDRLYFKPDNLRLIESHITAPQKAAEFKVGDKVRIVKEVAYFIGKTGTVMMLGTSCGRATCQVQLDDRVATTLFYADGLELISSQSQQPNQPNKPKEDPMKPYAVIHHDLSATTSNMQSQHATEEEAKEAAERLAAENRSQVTKRTFFTITIINTKTGELIGSVTDAPPALDWNKQCLPS